MSEARAFPGPLNVLDFDAKPEYPFFARDVIDSELCGMGERESRKSKY